MWISPIYKKQHFCGIYSVSVKKDQMFFRNISYKTRAILMKFGVRFAKQICYKNVVNVFHLTWIMSLHHLVKLEILITQVLPLRCQRKKLQNLSHLNCGLQIRQIWIQLITVCGNTAREGVQNMHHWSGWTEQQLRTELTKLDHVVIVAAIRQWRRR